MKILLASLLSILLLGLAPPASACHSCGGWGDSCGSMLDVASTPSAGQRDALIACDRVQCAVECADYLDSYDACVLTQDPSATIDGMSDDCASCQAGIGAWSGIGCSAELVACSYDLTCCTSCGEWLDGGDGANLCLQNDGAVVIEPTSITLSSALSACACAAAGCASKCGSACVSNGAGGSYFEPSLATFKCGVCLAAGACAASYNACAVD